MSYPKTIEDAKAHINQIRASKGLDGSYTNTSDLQNALVILSDQLYQKSTHFLSELIQNADDNTYRSTKPTLVITFYRSERSLRIDCNEVGFSQDDVDAICRIGRSTKSTSSSSTRYIGEKGVGFKSVFKVADEVHLQSGNYSFKFDRNAKLGMIAPIWATFPGSVRPGGSSILLRLSGDSYCDELEQELKMLDPRLLLFLRKLERIEVMSFNRLGSITASTLQRNEEVASLDRAKMISVSQNKTATRFKIIEVDINRMPYDARREGCTISKLLLGFPVDERNDPSIAYQKAYAFLPIRDYGCKFLIQSDFILIASREDIDASSAWNQHLLTCIPEAFLHAVDIFTRGELRYSWIRYLPSHSSTSGFFEQLSAALLRYLSEAPIIFSSTGVLMRPSDLRHAGSNYRDINGTPLLKCSRTLDVYISEKYSIEDTPILEQLGVSSLLPMEFAAHLRHFVHEETEAFQKMSGTWHTQVAAALLIAMTTDPYLADVLGTLPIIPLRTGQWVSSTSQQLYFPRSDQDPSPPPGTLVGEIDPSAVADASRRLLFEELGAEAYSTHLVCAAIVKEQTSPGFDTSTLKLGDYLNRTKFLFFCAWKNHLKTDLWVVTEENTVKRASDTYMQSSKPNSAQTILKNCSTPFNFLHREYHRAPATESSEWNRWLRDNLLVAEYPRLVITWPKVTLAQDLRVLRKEDPIKLLLLLRDRWEGYCGYFTVSESSNLLSDDDKTNLRNTVAAIKVPCTGGQYRPLSQTTLPDSNIIASTIDAIDFMHIPEPEDPRWHFLRTFGVVTNVGTDQFIQYLRQMRCTTVSLKRVTQVYQQLHALVGDNVAEIRSIFECEQLIFIPASSTLKMDTWVDSSKCAWSGPIWLRKIPLLEDNYLGLSSFFCNTLGIRKATWRTILSEATCIQPSDDLAYISRIFRALDTYVEEADSTGKQEIIASTSHAYIFPIDAGQSGLGFDYMSSVRDVNIWFIADRVHLKESFHGLVPLLAIKADLVENIPHLLKALDLRDRLLTEAAGSDVQTQGTEKVHTTFTAQFRAKVPFIARIMSTTNPRFVEIVEKLCCTIIYFSDAVSIQWTLKMSDGVEIIGRADAGRVKITHQKSNMQIFLRQDDADKGTYPLDLREGLAKFCELRDVTQIRLLDFIFNEQNLYDIDTELSRRGYQQPSSEVQLILNTKTPLDTEFGMLDEVRVPAPVDERRFQGHVPNTKRYRARRAEDEAPDTVEAFLAKFNLASAFRKQLSQPWAEAGADNLLAHACRLDGVDPWNLLPRNRNQWDELLRAKGKPPGAGTRTFWSANRHIQGKQFLSDRRNVRNAYAAVVLQDQQRNMVIKISNGIENLVTDELQFAAEHYVSRMFEQHLGKSYIASLHWTSPLRTRAGHLPFHSEDETASTFTIDDHTGGLVNTLRHPYRDTNPSHQARLFHIEVIASEGGLGDKFCLDPDQVQKAWRCHTEEKQSQSEVFILARVINIRTKPRLAVFVDPWGLHQEGHMNLESSSQYEATLSTNAGQARCIFLDEHVTNSQSASENTVDVHAEDSRGKWFRRRRLGSRTVVQETLPVRSFEPKFSYQPLQVGQIRLLELRGGSGEMALTGEVHHVTAVRCPAYNALSYVWGSATKSFSMSTSQGPISLTSSLHAALRRLRKKEEKIYLWVDAICINQEDNYEKATQIRMLPVIYQTAEIVLCWLGEADEDSDQAAETLMQIRTLELAPDTWPADLSPISDQWKDGIPDINYVGWWSIQSLFEREWFSRVWVIQEMVFAQEVKLLCGEYEIDWEDVMVALEICLNDPGEPLPIGCILRQIRSSFLPAHTLGLTRRAFRNKAISARLNLISLLDVFSHAKSTKARDKLFALLGMASDAGAVAFDPDYSSSLVDVIQRFACEFVKRGRTSALLYRAGSGKSVSFASWIPNWVTTLPHKTLSTWRGSNGVFKASAQSSMQANIHLIDQKVLQVVGSFVDTIQWVSMVSQRSKDIISLIDDARAAIDQLKSYPTGESLEQVKLKAIIGSAVAPCYNDTAVFDSVINPEDGNEDMMRNAFDWQDDTTPMRQVSDVVKLMEQKKSTRDARYRYYLTAAALFERLGHGRFFTTERGYVGIAPDKTRVGDRICIIHGASVPFVLRETKHHQLSQAQLLIGEGYVHGIMYGQGLSAQGVQVETISIR